MNAIKVMMNPNPKQRPLAKDICRLEIF